MDMGDSATVLLAGAEIHGFGTTADLDLNKLMEDATMRWLRPNEVHAILSNYMLFKIQPQPVDNPPSGTVLLFDRKMLRNFRRDGHNWKKKKDGKTVQEAHEKLKIGNEERIHVYYARNEDDPNFYRRCYWLLDRDLERIVLVHYRQTSEETANRPSSLPGEPKEASHSINSPVTPLDSVSGSQSEISGSVVVSEEDHFMINDGSATRTLEPTRMVGLDDLEKLDWGDIMEQPVQIDSSFSKNGDFRAASQEMDYQFNDSRSEVTGHQKRMQGDRNVNISNQKKQNMLPFQQVVVSARKKDQGSHQLSVHGRKDMAGSLVGNAHHIQTDSGSWNHIGGDSPGIFDGSTMQSLPSGRNGSETIHYMGPTSIIKPAFSIKDISTTWAYAGEETKVIVAGHFIDCSKQLECSAIFCVFGNECIPAEQIQIGVFRIIALLHEPGVVDFYMTLDGRKPVSDVISFECRQCPSSQTSSAVSSPSIDSPIATFQELDVLKRLSHLLFSTTNPLSSLSSKVAPNSLKEAKQFAKLSSSMLDADWRNYLTQNNTGGSFSSSTFRLLELLLENKLQEWILLKVVEGCRVTPRDREGQGAIHLCAMLDYAWAVRLFQVSGFSLDFRDVHGWTAIHWAAHYGRERTVAALLTAGANPSLVTDPAPGFPGGYTAADLACMRGFEGLGAYLAEKGLQAHYQAMTKSGNASGLQYQATDLAMPNFENSDNFSEQELCLKDSLAAYRNAADAADRIQAAFRERSHKQQMKAAQMENAEVEAASIVAALKIQKAYRDYNRRKMMKAAARIQGVFRTWKARRNFLNLRRQVIKIQALFRGRQARQQYHKFCWSVGVLEKAVLRWRMKRKGLRGLQAELDKTMDVEEDNCVEEEFYRVSREQAEDRVQRSVVRVQSMFRSYKAQQEYRRMKLMHNQAKLEYNFVHHGDGFNY